MFWIIVFLVCVVLFCLSVSVQLKERRDMEKRMPKGDAPKPIAVNGMVYPDDQERIEDFVKYYKQDFNKDETYQLSAKELKEDYEGERIYKYYPFKLDYKIEGNDVLAELKDEYVKIGTLTDEQIEYISSHFSRLNIYMDEYKDVEDTIEHYEGDPFFGFFTKEIPARKKKM